MDGVLDILILGAAFELVIITAWLLRRRGIIT